MSTGEEIRAAKSGSGGLQAGSDEPAAVRPPGLSNALLRLKTNSFPREDAKPRKGKIPFTMARWFKREF
jgi:hypothetical protein